MFHVESSLNSWESPGHSHQTGFPQFSGPIHDLFHLRVLPPDTSSVSGEMLEILTPEALHFLELLEERFGETRRQLLAKRQSRNEELKPGRRLDFLPETQTVRDGTWQISPLPNALKDRRIEVIGSAKSVAPNAIGAIYIADFEDSLSPTWQNMICGQVQLRKVEKAGKMIRIRGLHLEDKHFKFDSRSMSASLIDFGLFCFHNLRDIVVAGASPSIYLPKLESHLEARFWNDVFDYSEEKLGVSHGSIRTTVTIETAPAAFEMDEILFELRDHVTALQAGRSDYFFSLLKFSIGAAIPHRSLQEAELSFIESFENLLVETCHRRGALAIMSLSSFEGLHTDTHRAIELGFDGVMVPSADWAPAVNEIFCTDLKNKTNQVEFRDPKAKLLLASDLWSTTSANEAVTDERVNRNISDSLAYISAWLRGEGAVENADRIQDAAATEISRTELRYWVASEVPLAAGIKLSRAEFRRRLESEHARFAGSAEAGRLSESRELLTKLVLADEFHEYLTLPAYDVL